MKTFRTTFTTHYPHPKINLKTPILLVGSCFAENIGELLLQHKFHALCNPFGTIFNPLSISHLIQTTLQEKSPDENGFLEHDERWFHLDYHSLINGATQEELLQKIFHAHFQAKQFLTSDGLLILTLGTAWVYWHKPTCHYVANCHKQPSLHFEKKLLSVEEVVASLEALHQTLPPQLKILLTVSPVRHLKDTIPLNSVSKATLRLATHQLTEKYPERFAYFPAYELLLDDLRDYRFFAEDMIHPNSIAIQYVWEHFLHTCVD
ncbi:MAG: GSCFA domain-containing protein, partial [Flammeovirgaceae bacterium]|nr:GSCFA domain-containing protein [Flammeovirgaceae bacterium]MDW8286904.1 GSCFA domain-containing protein [Flammeovirgaceae bacterium]